MLKDLPNNANTALDLAQLNSILQTEVADKTWGVEFDVNSLKNEEWKRTTKIYAMKLMTPIIEHCGEHWYSGTLFKNEGRKSGQKKSS